MASNRRHFPELSALSSAAEQSTLSYSSSLPLPIQASSLFETSMDSQSVQYTTSRRTGGGFDSPSTRPLDMWGDSFRAENSPRTGTSTSMEADVKVDTRSEDAHHGTLAASRSSDQEANKPNDKVLRRLAQNREAARKSRMRKKVYVQQLETSRAKLSQLEQELERARQQGIYIGGNSGDHNNATINGAANTGAAAFDMEYGHWVEEQNRQICELRAALQAHVTDIELRILVDNGMAHYEELFRMKSVAAKSDVFHLVSGMWKTPAERCFMWMGGFRPSELLKILTPQLEPLTEQQVLSVCNLQQSSQQAEDALSQGMEALQQSLADTLAGGSLGAPNVANYMGQMAMAMGKLGTLESFVHQASLGVRWSTTLVGLLFSGQSPPADSAADVSHSYNSSSSTRPACHGGLFSPSSSTQFSLGCSSS